MEINMPVMTDLLVLLLLYGYILYPRWKKQGADMLAVKTLMYAHFALVLFVTLMPVLVALPFFGETRIFR